MQKRTDRLITNPEAFASSYEEENNNTPESNVKKFTTQTIIYFWKILKCNPS